MSTHKPHKAHKPNKPHVRPEAGAPSGRVAFDDRGNATWEWRSEAAGLGGDIDTGRLKAIGADLSIACDRVPETPHDPYNRSAPAPSGQARPRKRSLDDLRRLSQEIKAAPYWKDRRSR